MEAEEEQERLRELLVRLGAEPRQARTMARQLAKRADQLSSERGVSREQAMDELLRLVVAGRRGETPPGFEGEGEEKI